VSADPVRLEQAIGNLIVNAAKFTPAGGAITVEAFVDGGEGVIAVTDNGVGIRPDMLESIFDLFAQSEVTIARTAGGLGIGLTLVKRLLELHGGQVRARARAWGRARASRRACRWWRRPPIGVPRRASTSRRPPSASSSPRTARTRASRWGCCSRPGTTRSCSRRRARGGAPGARGAARYRADRHRLPGFDGYAVAREIRGEGTSWARKVRLVALTGYGQASDRTRALEAGFDAHMLKPVDPRSSRPDRPRLVIIAAMEVLIVGAGVGGLTLALELHRHGIGARVFEAAAQIRPVGPRHQPAAHATRELARLGLEDALARVAVARARRCSSTASAS
jgi:CheY-like chemotaxis protein